MDRSHEARAAFLEQAQFCRALGSPLTAMLCDVLAEKLDRATRVGARVLDWPGDPAATADALPLRLAAGLNGLVLGGHATQLAAFYPPNPLTGSDRFWPAVRSTLERQADPLIDALASPPQTNEVSRSAVLMAGMSVAVDRWALPVSLFELGASAGLNLLLDRYAYRLGTTEAGRSDSSVRLAPEWTGASPPTAAVNIVARRGCDQAPVDLSDPTAVARLLSFVWPDQAARLERLNAALAIAASARPIVDRADAGDWLEAIPEEGPSGVGRIVMHSIAFQYFPSVLRQRIVARLDALGAAATPTAPLGWLRFEAEPGTRSGASLRLTVWPGGQDLQLAVADAHVRAVTWLA